MGWKLRIATVLVALASAVTALPAQPAAGINNLEQYLLDLVNAGRRQRNIPVLQENAIISAEVKNHAESMARRNRMDHAGIDGRGRRIRAQDDGIDQSHHMCENVGYSFGRSNKGDMRAIYKGWVKSAVHRNCMFDGRRSPRHQVAGIGIASRGQKWFAAMIVAQDDTP